MGAWGAGLYQDDEAADLKNTIALLAKLPRDGDALLEILLAAREGPVSLEQDGGPTFWLVVADQFERKGIRCPRAFAQGLAAIESGADTRDMAARGMGERDLDKRGKALQELAGRLRAPRPARAPPKSGKLPPFLVQPGEAYAFPTMRHAGMNPWFASWEEANFQPDGWGAMLVLATGRCFDYFPWCAKASLSVNPATEPTLDDARAARLLSEAGYAVPRALHMKRQGMRLIGTLALDPARAEAAISGEHTVLQGVLAGWSTYVDGWRGHDPAGPAVAALLSVQAGT